jgi:hypothetical protein
MHCCQDGCVPTEIWINFEEENYLDLDNYQETWNYLASEKVEKTQCLQVIDDYGHWNYAVTAYAASKGHLKCLESLRELGASYHSDIAIVAAENGQYECLVFIVKNFTEYELDLTGTEHVEDPQCREFLTQESQKILTQESQKNKNGV